MGEARAATAGAVRVTKAMLNALASPTRLADVSLFDPELLTAVLTGQRAAGAAR